MIKFLRAIGIVIGFPFLALANPYQQVVISTTTGKATMSLSGVMNVAASSATPNTSTIILNGATGVVSATSFTGAGTGLTGTAGSLSIGGNATTATTATTATNLSGISNSVGINDTSPDAQLGIISNKGSAGFVVQVSSQNDSGNDLFDILGNGNVGIGTAGTAAAPLEVDSNSTIGTGGFVVKVSSADQTTVLLGVTSSGGTQIRGSALGDTASAGYVGELISANGSGTPTPAATGTYVAISTITLTAGTWDIYGSGYFSTGATTAATGLQFAVSTSNTSLDNGNVGNIIVIGGSLAVNTNYAFTAGPRRVSVSANTQYFLIATLTFTTLGGATYGGNQIFLRATRIR